MKFFGDDPRKASSGSPSHVFVSRDELREEDVCP